MALRQSLKLLTQKERDKYITAVKLLKSEGKYDWYVETHVNTQRPDGTNAAHRGPAFLPWHRQFLLLYERDLQRVLNDPNFGLPYWNWAEDAALSDPTQSPVWGNDFMGGQGNPVNTGPFAAEQWTLWKGGNLVRMFGVDPEARTLPNEDDVRDALAVSTYDSSPWNDRYTNTNSFRNKLEGFVTVYEPKLHNRVHRWIGGSMAVISSPNDPVFFLHHCYIDYLWATWQAKYPNAGYLPTEGAQAGHNLNDLMWPWDSEENQCRPIDVLDHRALGYRYPFLDYEVQGVSKLSFDGQTPLYTLDPNYKEMVVQGNVPGESAKLQFEVYLPKFNPNALCGPGQALSACVWVTDGILSANNPPGGSGNAINTQLGVYSNYKLATEKWVTAGPFTLKNGPFKIVFSSGESDGCGWPADTLPCRVRSIKIT